MGMVLTLVIVTDESSHYDALRAALEAAREHPSRILGVIPRGGRGAARLDAEVRVGGEAGPGESVLLRLYGDLARHAESVVLPLLLPDSPVVVWWPSKAPEVPAQDPVGRLAQRRITDAGVLAPFAGHADLALRQLPARRHRPVVDPHHTMAGAAGRRTGPAAQPGDRRDHRSRARQRQCRPARRVVVQSAAGAHQGEELSKGPGITAALLHSEAGDIAITRPDGRLARYTVPGQPERHVALKRRDAFELLAEELRRLDPDDVYAETVTELLDRAHGNGRGSATKSAESARSSAGERPRAGPTAPERPEPTKWLAR